MGSSAVRGSWSASGLVVRLGAVLSFATVHAGVAGDDGRALARLAPVGGDQTTIGTSRVAARPWAAVAQGVAELADTALGAGLAPRIDDVGVLGDIARVRAANRAVVPLPSSTTALLLVALLQPTAVIARHAIQIIKWQRMETSGCSASAPVVNKPSGQDCLACRAPVTIVAAVEIDAIDAPPFTDNDNPGSTKVGTLRPAAPPACTQLTTLPAAAGSRASRHQGDRQNVNRRRTCCVRRRRHSSHQRKRPRADWLCFKRSGAKNCWWSRCSSCSGPD